jgi:hypothetical protein
MEIYNTKYICTYNNSNVFLETDNVNELEKNFIKNILYKKDLLNIFKMDEDVEDEEFNDALFNNTINKIFLLIKEDTKNNRFISCINKLSDKHMMLGKEVGFMLLFSFDYLYLSHTCICEFLEIGKMNEDSLNLLLNKIK